MIHKEIMAKPKKPRNFKNSKTSKNLANKLENLKKSALRPETSKLFLVVFRKKNNCKNVKIVCGALQKVSQSTTGIQARRKREKWGCRPP